MDALEKLGLPVRANIPPYEETYHLPPEDPFVADPSELSLRYSRLIHLANETEKLIGEYESKLKELQAGMKKLEEEKFSVDGTDKQKYRKIAEVHRDTRWLALKEEAEYCDALLSSLRPMFNGYVRSAGALSREQSRWETITKVTGGGI